MSGVCSGGLADVAGLTGGGFAPTVSPPPLGISKLPQNKLLSQRHLRAGRNRAGRNLREKLVLREPSHIHPCIHHFIPLSASVSHMVNPKARAGNYAPPSAVREPPSSMGSDEWGGCSSLPLALGLPPLVTSRKQRDNVMFPAGDSRALDLPPPSQQDERVSL